jgi:hypothetical protein
MLCCEDSGCCGGGGGSALGSGFDWTVWILVVGYVIYNGGRGYMTASISSSKSC